jgi:hypothetical protein
MPEAFTHFLLTRFNASMALAASTRRLDSGWLNARLALFEQYCFPSVAAQTCTNFHWLVFFDAASPSWFKQRVSLYSPLVQPVYIDGVLTDELIACKVRDTNLLSSPYLISTRLDNDDAISKNHIALVQSAFSRQHRQFLTFPLGLQSFHGHLYKVYWPSNPFLSLIEKVGHNGQLSTVCCVRHDLVSHSNSLRRLWSSCQWLQTLHSSNVCNTLRGWPRLKSRSHPHFDVLWPEALPNDSLPSRIRFSANSYLARASNFLARATARSQGNLDPS